MKGGFSNFCILDLSLWRSLTIAVHPSRYSQMNVSVGGSQMKLGGCLTLSLWLFNLIIQVQSAYFGLYPPDPTPLPFSSLFLLFLQSGYWIFPFINQISWQLCLLGTSLALHALVHCIISSTHGKFFWKKTFSI